MTSQQQASTTPSEERDEWRTPQYLRTWAHGLWRLDIDLAATLENRVCDDYLSMAEGTDALALDWHRLGREYRVGWCNPPYSNPRPWVVKAIEEAIAGFTTVLLLPGQRSDQRDVLLAKATEIVFFCGRIAFTRPDGTDAPANIGGNLIAVYRGRDLGLPRVRWVQRDVLRECYG